MVSEAIQRDKETTEKEEVMAMDSDANLPESSDDDDWVLDGSYDLQVAVKDENEEGDSVRVKRQAKYEAWKVRELKRILRDK